jgi:hypothetical protein
MNPPVPAGVDGKASDALLELGRFFTRWEESDDHRVAFRKGGRAGDVFYRDRWSHDKVVRSTHGVNCTGSCSWKIYVRDGIITWEAQQTDYPSVDRYGGRVMFTVLTFASAVPVLLVALAGSLKSYSLLLVFGFFLGIAGTTFAVGIPFVNAWFEPARRGFATGVFGAGMGGTALSAFFTPRLVRSIGYVPTHLLIAAALVVLGAVLWLLLRDSPAWKPNLAPVIPKLAAAAKLPLTWQMAFLYAVTFGGFVAFSTYLPTYLKNVYAFGLTGAGTRTAGFAIAAVIARPIGGTLADKIGAKKVVAISSSGQPPCR